MSSDGRENVKKRKGRTPSWHNFKILNKGAGLPSLVRLTGFQFQFQFRFRRQNSCRPDSSWPNLSLRKVDHVETLSQAAGSPQRGSPVANHKHCLKLAEISRLLVDFLQSTTLTFDCTVICQKNSHVNFNLCMKNVALCPAGE